MRLCQPLPVDLKASRTSISNRTVVDFFVAVPGGRPRMAFSAAFSEIFPGDDLIADFRDCLGEKIVGQLRGVIGINPGT